MQLYSEPYYCTSGFTVGDSNLCLIYLYGTKNDKLDSLLHARGWLKFARQPHHCPVCCRSFTYNAALTRHMATHAPVSTSQVFMKVFVSEIFIFD